MSTTTTATAPMTTAPAGTAPARTVAAPRRPLRARWVVETMPDGRARLSQTWSQVPAAAHAGRVTLAA